MKPSTHTAGGLYALGAFGIWGFVPLFFKAIDHIGADEILAHRVIWAMVLVTVFLGLRGRAGEVQAVLRQPKLIGVLFLTALLVALNWFIFIWAVHNGHVLETSLGYYINPLFNVLLGAIFLRERLRRSQMAAVAIATTGVATLVIQSGSFPWISLTLGGSFSLYGLIRKVTPVKPVVGMQLESLVLTPIAVGYLVWLAGRSEISFGTSLYDTSMLVAAGAVTAVPLIFFAEAAQRLMLATVGFFQYLAPTLQFFLAVALFGEAFTLPYAIAFACIWTALALYSLDGHLSSRMLRTESAAARRAPI